MNLPATAEQAPHERLSFGAALRRFRMQRGLEQNHIALRVGVSKWDVKRWEREDAYPTSVQYKRLCATLPQMKHYEAASHSPRISPAPEPPQPPKSEQSAIAQPVESTTIPRTFGEALRRARAAESLDQDEVGSLLSVTGQAVSAWEHDIANPILSHYCELLELFPTLSKAPQPHAQDIEKPDGGKGAPRDTCSAPPARSVVCAAAPRSHGASPAVPSRPPEVPSEAPIRTPLPPVAPQLSESRLPPIRDAVEQAGAEYAQARLNLRRAELLVIELRQLLIVAESQSKEAETRVQAADDILKKAVAEAARDVE